MNKVKTPIVKEKIKRRWIHHLVECPKRVSEREYLVVCQNECKYYRGTSSKIVEMVNCAYLSKEEQDE